VRRRLKKEEKRELLPVKEALWYGLNGGNCWPFDAPARTHELRRGGISTISSEWSVCEREREKETPFTPQWLRPLFYPGSPSTQKERPKSAPSSPPHEGTLQIFRQFSEFIEGKEGLPRVCQSGMGGEEKRREERRGGRMEMSPPSFSSFLSFNFPSRRRRP